MKNYRESTWGWIMLIVVAPALALIVYLHINNLGDRPLTNFSFTLITLSFFVTGTLFYRLKTEVTNDLIIVSFGIGLIRKRIRIENVRSVQQVENPWYYGWGIRFIPGGMLYNISGSKGIELTLHNSDRIIRIGSPHSLQLKLEIEKRLSKSL